MMADFVALAADVPIWIGGISTAVGVLAAIGTAFFAARQLLEVRKDRHGGRLAERRQRVYDLQQRYDESILPLMDQLFALVGEDQATAKTQWAEWARSEAGKVKLRDITKALNFFEQVASEYNFDLLDEQVAHQTLIYVLVTAWPRVRWFVQWLRDQSQEDRLLAQWETTYEAARAIYSPPIR